MLDAHDFFFDNFSDPKSAASKHVVKTPHHIFMRDLKNRPLQMVLREHLSECKSLLMNYREAGFETLKQKVTNNGLLLESYQKDNSHRLAGHESLMFSTAIEALETNLNHLQEALSYYYGRVNA